MPPCAGCGCIRRRDSGPHDVTLSTSIGFATRRDTLTHIDVHTRQFLDSINNAAESAAAQILLLRLLRWLQLHNLMGCRKTAQIFAQFSHSHFLCHCLCLSLSLYFSFPLLLCIRRKHFFCPLINVETVLAGHKLRIRMPIYGSLPSSAPSPFAPPAPC